MAEVVEEAFGLPLGVAPAGIALTPNEAQEPRPRDNQETEG